MGQVIDKGYDMVLNKLTALLSPLVNSGLTVITFTQQHQLLFALLSGLTLPFFAAMKNDERQKAQLWKKLIIACSLLCFLFGTLAPLVIWIFQWLHPRQIISNNMVISCPILIAVTLGGFIFHILALPFYFRGEERHEGIKGLKQTS